MKLVFDTNIIMDVIARREPFFDASRTALLMATENGVTGAMTANTATDIFFLYRKYQPDMGKRKEALRYLMSTLDVLDIRLRCVWGGKWGSIIIVNGRKSDAC